MNRTLAPWMVVALFVAWGSLSTGGSKPPLPAAAAAEAPAAPAAPEYALPLLREHFALRAQPPSDAEALRAELARRGKALDVLVATLPHPRDSHLDWAFDSQLDSIRRAFERTSYVLDRMRLPWERAASSDEARSDGPGTLLFRRTSGASEGARADLWIVYLVPELSTGGVDKEALLAALRERAQLVPQPTGAVPRELRVLGPTFSGSSPSLRMALDAAVADPHCQLAGCTVRIVSGAATGSANHDVLTRHAALATSFETTLHTDAELQALLFERVLPRLEIRKRELAVLQESTTEYGLGLSAAAADDDEVLRVPFPMSIASLRTAAVAGAAQDPSAPVSPTRSAPTRTKFELSDVPRPRESIGAASSLTAPSIDLLLEELSRSLSQRGIKAVLIFATDVRDKLFLGAELKKRLPELQLLTTEGNVLYLRPEFNAWLRGMLVLSTYPLLLRDPTWNPQAQDGQELAFANEGAEGVYNAVLAQLGNFDAFADFAQPSGADPSLPVWLTAVGSSSMLPVAVLNAPAADGSAPPPAPPGGSHLVQRERGAAAAGHAPQRAHRAGGGSFAAVFSTCALSLLLLWVVWLQRKRGERVRPPMTALESWKAFDWAERHREVEHAGLELHRDVYAALVFVALLGLLAPNVALMDFGKLFELDGLAPARFAGCVALAVGLAAVAACAARIARTLGDWGRRGAWHAFCANDWPRPEPKRAWRWELVLRSLSFGVGPVYFALTLLLCVEIQLAAHAEQRSDFAMFFERAVEVDQGLSPLVPLTALGLIMAAWCRWHYERVEMLARTQPARALFERRPALDGTVWERLFRALPDAGARWLLLALCAGGGLVLLRFEPTWERIVGIHAFDWLLRLGIVGALCASLWACYRLISVWTAFRADLAELADEMQTLPFTELKKTHGLCANLRLWPTWTRRDIDKQIAQRRQVVRARSGGSRDQATTLAELVSGFRLGPPAVDARSETDRTAASELTAMESLRHVEWVLRHLRRLCFFLLITLLLTTFLVSSYPFHPREICRVGSLLVFAAVVAVLVVVIAAMNRDPVLSRMAGSDPGELNWDRTLVMNVVMYVLVPALTLLSSQYPELRTLLTNWAKPLIDGVLRV